MNNSIPLENYVGYTSITAAKDKVTTGDHDEFASHMRKLHHVESLKETIEDVVQEMTSNGMAPKRFLKNNKILMTADKENGYRVAIGSKVTDPAYKDECIRPMLLLTLYHNGSNSLNVSMIQWIGDRTDQISQEFDISDDIKYLQAKDSIRNYLTKGCGKKIFNPGYKN